MRSIDHTINRIGDGQFGVVTSRQLREEGISRNVVKNRIDAGRLRRIHPNVFAIGYTDVTEVRLRAATARAGTTGRLSHETSLQQYGAWKRGNKRVNVASTTRIKSCDQVRYFQIDAERLGPIEWIRDQPLMEFHTAFAYSGAQLTQYQLANVLHESEYLRLLDIERLDHVRQRLGSVRGAVAVRNSIQLRASGSVGSRSATEDRLFWGMERAGIPIGLVNTRGATPVRQAELDVVYPHKRLVIEVDGSGHGRLPDALNDVEIDGALAEHGWYVERIPAERVWNNLPEVLARISCLLSGAVIDSRCRPIS